MWPFFWRSRNRFSLDELKYLNDQLWEIQTVNDTNEDFVIETLRSIAELITYGDQHDSSFFDFFMERQIMAQFIRILKISKTMSVAIQLLQTLSIMIQNLRTEHALYYLFSNEHVNNLITYQFDFHNEELLNYYISFLRAISGKLDKNTISLLVKTQNDEVVSFPLYSESIKFVNHEENMIRIAVRALTLNIYKVSDESVHKFIMSHQVAGYFLDLVNILRQQCFKMDSLVVDAAKAPDSSHITGKLHVVAEEIGDSLCYCNDIICAGVPSLSRLMTHHLLHSLILPMLLPSLHSTSANGMRVSACTSLYLLSFILQEMCFKDLGNSVGVALLYPPVVFTLRHDTGCNGHEFARDLPHKTTKLDQESGVAAMNNRHVTMQEQVNQHNVAGSSVMLHTYTAASEESGMDQKLSSREILLSYVNGENDKLVLGSLSMLVALLQSKELDDSVLDALGILPQKKQHKKLLLQALMGSKSEEEQLFASSLGGVKDEIYNELELYIQNLKSHYHLPILTCEQGGSPGMHRYQVLDALIMLLCRRPPPAAEALWHAGWLLRQLLPYHNQKFSDHHLNLLNDAYKKASADLLKEVKDCWCDLIPAVLIDEWKKCKKAIEIPALEKGPTFVLLPDLQPVLSDGDYSSSFVGERMRDVVKVFVLHCQLRSSVLGGNMHENPQLGNLKNSTENSRVRRAGLDIATPKIGSELTLAADDALLCRIAFERGKERHFYFLAVSKGTSGCMLLAEEMPLKPHCGVVRITAPLAGSNVSLTQCQDAFSVIKLLSLCELCKICKMFLKLRQLSWLTLFFIIICLLDENVLLCLVTRNLIW
eukprot:Gb_22834 [translate_table: standard]